MQILQEKTNRNYKDSVFVDLFAHDITAKENFTNYSARLPLAERDRNFRPPRQLYAAL